MKKIWTDSSEQSNPSATVSKGKRVVIGHAGSAEGFVDNVLLLCGKDILKYERWSLIESLIDRKTLIVLDNAKNPYRLMEKDTFNENEKKMV